MTKDIWLNLPVKDLKRSKAFFTRLGFRFSTKHGDSPVSACMLIGAKDTIVMLFDEKVFQSFTLHNITDTELSSEILISIDAESRAEVDELARKAEEAGAKVFAKPGEKDGWMYGCGFSDPDGHRWNVLYMDLAKMLK